MGRQTCRKLEFGMYGFKSHAFGSMPGIFFGGKLLHQLLNEENIKCITSEQNAYREVLFLVNRHSEEKEEKK